jgi:hypothetical protein
MSPFIYPAAPHTRRHGPQGYADYASYRPWLRDEFSFRCVFCLNREKWRRVRWTFDLDHFLPAALHPDLARTYENLLYSCRTCNGAKGDEAIPDPCQALLNGDVTVHDDGALEARTADARRIVRVLGLDDREATEFRRLWIEIVALAERSDQPLYRRLMGFPDDLPDLTRLRPPSGNVRPAGIRTSFFARRKAGTLPATY